MVVLVVIMVRVIPAVAVSEVMAVWLSSWSLW